MSSHCPIIKNFELILDRIQYQTCLKQYHNYNHLIIYLFYNYNYFVN